MNIFFLHENPYEAAQMQADKHVVKMIVETAQILSTAHRLLDGDEKGDLDDDRSIFYKITHRNHPSSVWARTSVENYNWLVDHFHGLLNEYTFRYGKTHKSSRLLYLIQSPPHKLEDWDWTTPPSCMPDEFKVGDYIENYREYYRKGKSHLHKWTRRNPPDWLRE